MTKTQNNISEVEETTQLPIKVENLGIVYEDKYKKMSQSHNSYGDGKACQRIVDVLAK